MCPPGTDQTERGGFQRWNLLAPSLKQRQQLFSAGGRSNSGMMKFMSSAKSAPLINAFYKLARPNSTPSGSADTISKPSERPFHSCIISDNISLSHLEALPAEILAIVINTDSLSRDDVLRLGSSSQTLWSHVERHVREDCRKTAAPWAGTPLIATGDWLRDLPQALYDILPEIQEDDRRWRQEVRVHSMRIFMPRGRCPARRWNSNATWGGSCYEDVERRSVREEWLVAGENLPGPLMSRLEKAVTVLCPRTGEKWFLRNISSSEFVRLEIEEVGESGVRALVEGSVSLSLDEALLLKILWTRPMDTYEREDLKRHFTRGEWAGHSFDVVPNGGSMTQGWRDVTPAVISLAASVSSELGSGS